MSLAVISTITWIGIAAVAASVVVLLFIVLVPWPREGRRLDRDVETRLLLHEDPEDIADELDAHADEPRPVAELRPDDRR